MTSGVLLEAMGNARTTHNSNSSRFVSFLIKLKAENEQLNFVKNFLLKLY